MDIGTFLTSLNKFDLLVVLFCFGMFVLGFVQGTIRRVLGLASLLFAFLLAANLRSSLGQYLAQNWNQFPDEYAIMLGFLIVFVVVGLGFTGVIQAFYHHQPLFRNQQFADELIGGLLGILQALFLVGATIVILDSFFRLPGIAPSGGELPFLRNLWQEIDTSTTADVFRSTFIPAFNTIFGVLVPGDIQQLYVTG